MGTKQTKLNMIVLLAVVLAMGSVADATAPIVNGGENQTMYPGETIDLQGTASDPVDGDTIEFWEWVIYQGPLGHDGVLTSPYSPGPLFSATVLGQYVISVYVIDSSYEYSIPDFLVIDVIEDVPPVAVLSASVTEGPAPLTVQFDGSDSYDEHGDTLDYYWSFGDGYTGEGITVEHTYHYEGQYIADIIIVDSGGQADFDTITITVTPGGNIQVSPEAYDFGDVELTTSSSTIITITNPVGGTYEDPLVLSDISFAEGSSGDFAITTNPAGSTVPVGESVDVGVTFTPTAEGYVSAVLQINSDDPVFGLMEVALGGVGVDEELPPEGQIAATLSFIQVSVDAGTLAGDGLGNSAENRLNAFINMLEASGDLIQAGETEIATASIETEEIEMACGQLASALKKCDGQPKPPDFVTGDAAAVVKSMIDVLRTSLGCE